VADDHAVVRLAVRTALEADGIEVVAEASDAAGAVEAALRLEPDVCLLDLHMPGNGLWAARRIASKAPATAVVMLTVADGDDDLLDAVRSGVAGYLPKDTDLARLGAALEGVLHGETAIPRAYMTRLLGELREGGRTAKRVVPGRASVTVTSREREVLQLLEHGLTTAEMARRLFVSPATVRTHVASLLRKFGVADRAALLAVVGERGETSTPD
jgi:DNA-binding NarL/FixJ family response regulator